MTVLNCLTRFNNTGGHVLAIPNISNTIFFIRVRFPADGASITFLLYLALRFACVFYSACRKLVFSTNINETVSYHINLKYYMDFIFLLRDFQSIGVTI